MSIVLLIAGSLILVSPSLAALINIKLNGPLVSGGDVGEFQVSPDSSRVVYRADQDTDEVYELYVSYETPVSSTYLPIIVKGYSP